MSPNRSRTKYSASISGTAYPGESDGNPHGTTSTASTSTSVSNISEANGSFASTSKTAFDHSSRNDSYIQDNGKRNRYQYSCLQCQRRKQRCSRTFPCEKCMQRGIAHLCSPPSNLHRPSRRIRMRQKRALAASNQDQDTSKQTINQDMDDMDTYELDDEPDSLSPDAPHETPASRRDGASMQSSHPFNQVGATEHSFSVFSTQHKSHEHQQPLHQTSQDANNTYAPYRPQHVSPMSPPRYLHNANLAQDRRAQSFFHMHPHADAAPLTSTPAGSNAVAKARALLSSSNRSLMNQHSPSDINTSPMHDVGALQTLAASSTLPTRGLASDNRTDALAQLATVAQWPSLQQHESHLASMNRPMPEASATASSPDRALNSAAGAAGRPFGSAIGLPAPSSSRSWQSAHGPESDQRSMVDADDAFIGKPALNGLGWNPFRRHEGIGTDLLSWTGQLGRGFGLVIPKYELRSVQQSLPSRAEAHRLLQIYLDDFNWSRFPASPSELLKAVDACIDHCTISDDVQMLPLMAYCLSIFGLATLDLAVRPYPTRPSRTYFFAARKALSLSESLGLHTLDSLSASLNLCRYLDLCRVPRSTWLQVASCMRGAIDLGLHLDGAHLGQNCAATLHRRVLWSHIVHQDREWSVLFGRPMTEIPHSTTPVATLEDYLNFGLDLACAQYLVVRDAFRVFIERISRLFQEIAASSNSSPSSRIYDRALEIDRDIIEFTNSLPPCISSASPSSGGAMRQQDFATTFYHHLCTNQILFFRSLLHRPFWMESSDPVSAERYKRSRELCVELALSDLRSRRLLSRRIPVTMLCHLYGSAYSLLSMNTIIASDMLFALEFDEALHSDEVQERLGYIQEYVATVRANIQESRGDHLAVKELYVMRSLLKRIQDKVATLNPQSVGFQVLGVRYPGGCADRLDMTLTELQSAANMLLNMARAGVRIDDATRIPPSGVDKPLVGSRSATSSGESSHGIGAGGVLPMGDQQTQGYSSRAFGYSVTEAELAGGTAKLAGDENGMQTMLGADGPSAVTPSADSLDLFLSNADEWLSSLLNPGAAAFSAPNQPLDFGFSLF
ncbi:uncharacterized protein PAN0_016d5224 [Moesziomyces antarcticus]|uniref:Uncharacterized protein n=2 Tax=Pseudozyma antarctica TaxID=84753 RepID=A0A5C3FV52_PSEA2|nr:uncharacterized protein PAN0_016d5224 [Moesziomyces antarcticus]GAK66999.1 conserved hypothetical protein [Moesziomyces antarcticus]SPO48244.1 uncharacterized protein PSANT_05932 [Moesziomyces antarcticus]